MRNDKPSAELGIVFEWLDQALAEDADDLTGLDSDDLSAIDELRRFSEEVAQAPVVYLTKS